MALTVHQLVLRRRAVAASSARRKARVAPKPAPPRGPVVAYAAALAALEREMDRAVADELRSAEILPRERVVRHDAPADGSAPAIVAAPVPSWVVARLVAAMTRRLLDLAAGARIVRVLDDVGRQVAAHAGEQFGRQLRAVIGVDPTAALGPDLVPRLRAWRERNLALITSLAQDKVDAVRAILQRHAPGGRVELIARDIEAEAGASPARAALIARDQVLSLNAQVTEERHRAAGITEYEWSSSHDARVRQRHRELDGRRFHYDDPPVVDAATGRRAHPGRDFQCRCVAIPVIPALDGR